MQDTTVAKQYFDEVLNIYGTTEYSNEVRKIYDGNKFGKLDRLPAIVAIENEKAVEEEERIKEEEKAIQDMKKEEAKSKEKKEPEKEKDKSDKEQN
jgi:sRNA-binding protein